MIGGLGTTELMIIAGIIFFLFGAKKLPQIAKGTGQFIKELRGAAAELDK